MMMDGFEPTWERKVVGAVVTLVIVGAYLGLHVAMYLLWQAVL